ncbi:MAG TPA: response regulator [Albitalea sp.]
MSRSVEIESGPGSADPVPPSLVRSVLNGLPFFVWLEDEQGRLLLANDEFERWMRDDAPQAEDGSPCVAFLGRTDAADTAGAQGLSERCCVDRRGERRWMEVWSAPLRLQGQPGVRLCHARDISSRKTVEQELKRTLAFVQGIIDAFPDFLFEGSADGRYLNTWTKNPEMLAASREYMLGRTLDEVLSPESAAIAKAAFREADEAGLSFGKVIAIDTSVGRRSFELSVSKMPMGDGEPPHFITVSRDVTARLDLQAELQQKEQQFRTLVENSPDVIARFDPSLRCLYANPALVARTPFATSVGLDPATLFGGAAGAELKERLATVLERGDASDFEMDWADAQGQALCSLVHLTPEFDATGKIASVLLIGRDLTERKRAEAERQAREAAEAASRAKGEFLASMSHEIRTPMNAIIGMSYLALQGSLNHQQQRYIQTVHRSAESLLGIINDILDFSKIEAGRLDMERIDFDLADVMDSLASLLGMRAEEKGLELIFDQSPLVPTRLVGDPSRLGQVLLNLGNNAVKFTEHGEIVVGVHVIERDEVSAMLRFDVRDTGIGISPAQRERLFRPFAQADASTSRRFGGTGLGLAICRRLVDLMGGEIEVDSEPGKGSRFSFSARLGVQPAAAAPLGDEGLQGARILIVDDNPSARQILVGMARTLGMRAESARSGEQALEMLAREDAHDDPYHLVLIDWKMPQMDGLACMRAIEQARFRQRAPAVLMVTGFGADELKQQLAQNHLTFGAVLAKPVAPSSLLDACCTALGRADIGQHRLTTRDEALQANQARLRGSRVLLVEDNAVNQELARTLLGRAGIVVTVVEDGQQAVDILAHEPFDGVLMDCQMPVMDGYTATAILRRDQRLQDLPIIAMTANAMVGDREKALAAGMNEQIGKPIKIDEMFATLARWIHPQSPGPACTSPQTQFDLLGQIPGIDVSTWVASRMGDADLYRRLLGMFLQDQQTFPAPFAAALAAADLPTARRLAHNLKSQAATLGAHDVDRAAKALEEACVAQAPRHRLQALLDDLAGHLHPVLEGLRNSPALKQSAGEPS